MRPFRPYLSDSVQALELLPTAAYDLANRNCSPETR